MRLSRLDLTRYGKFTDFKLDFGPRAPGRPDLHLVYGPNEAGKSTTFAAYLDLLFGIGGQSPYGFLHPYRTMQIGGLLDLAGGSRELVRIKRQQATLLDPAGRALDEGIVAAELGGIGRDAYETMFSLDDDTLEEGGRGILQSRGDLGQLLFQGSAGLAGLGRTLETLHDEADRFHKASAHKTGLRTLRDRLDALKEERDRIDVQASAYRGMVAARDAADSAYAEALRERGAAQARRDEIGRLLSALPRLADLRAMRLSLAPLLPLPHPPAGWTDELPGLERDELRLTTELAGIDREIATLAAEAEGIAVDEEALRAAEVHAALAEPRARAITAGEDLPHRRPRLQAVEAAITAALDRLGRPAGGDPAAALLDAATVGALRGLIASRSGVAERLHRAREEAEAARRDLAEARDAILHEGGPAGTEAAAALARLAGTVEALREADPGARSMAVERARTTAAEALADAMRALRPWPGSADDLAVLILPEAGDVEAWASAIAAAAAEAERRDEEAEGLSAERDLLAAEVDALGRIAGVMGEAQAAAVRAARERSWAAHRATLDAASADLFEDDLRRDDAVAAARFGQAGDVARLKEAVLKLAGVETRLKRAAERAATARRRGAEPWSAIAAALAAVDPPLPPDTTPARFGLWVGRSAVALRARVALRDVERDLEATETDLAAARDRLAAGLAEAGVPPAPDAPFSALMASARSAADRGRRIGALAAEAAAMERRADKRGRALADAEGAEARWRDDWAAACRACWLGEAGVPPPAAAVSEVLDVLAALAPDLGTRADLIYRIGAMEADEVAFIGRVASLAEALGLDAGPLSPDRALDLDRGVARRIQAARDARTARDLCAAKLGDARGRRSSAADRVAANRARGAAMRALFGVNTLAEVATGLDGAAGRERLRRDIEAAERDIRTGLRLHDLAGIEERLDGLDVAALDAELGTVEAGLPGLDARVQDTYARREAARAALERVGGDGAVARIAAERRVVLLEIEEQARRFIRLRGGVAAAEEALRIYRDRHRSGMLQQASEAFRIISRGAYRSLAAQPGDKGEVLMAVPAEGKTKEASELSKGTRFQLYLALRVAGYHEFVRARGPVPFVADDIMETFDDFRAEEAFRLFAGMAEVGQVIYLTHHRHLIEVARAACPGVSVHDLPAPPGPLSLAS